MSNERTKAWKSGVSERLGVPADEVLQWATSSGNYNDAQLAKFQSALNDPDMRDMTIERLAGDYLGSGAIQSGASRPPLQTGNTAGASAESSDTYSSINEYMADIAPGSKMSKSAADAKLRRSHQVINQTAMSMGTVSGTQRNEIG